MNDGLVAIIDDEVRQVHAIGTNSVYATLCGLDGNDPDDSVRQSNGGPVGAGEKITCPDCYAIWEHARSYQKRDFAGWLAK